MILDSISLIIDDKPPTSQYYLNINEGEKLINTAISYLDSPDMTADALACTNLANKVCIFLDDQTKERFDEVRDLLYKAVKQYRVLNEIKKDFE